MQDGFADLSFIIQFNQVVRERDLLLAVAALSETNFRMVEPERPFRRKLVQLHKPVCEVASVVQVHCQDVRVAHVINCRSDRYSKVPCNSHLDEVGGQKVGPQWSVGARLGQRPKNRTDLVLPFASPMVSEFERRR